MEEKSISQIDLDTSYQKGYLAGIKDSKRVQKIAYENSLEFFNTLEKDAKEPFGEIPDNRRVLPMVRALGGR
jgi:hypothetical protein